MRVIEDRDWLRRQIGALTATQEGVRAEPWAVTDAPEAFVEAQMKGIVGIEIPIARIEGKWKVSQNRPEADRRGVVDGLSRRRRRGEPGDGRPRPRARPLGNAPPTYFAPSCH